jgi:hypothetical protein
MEKKFKNIFCKTILSYKLTLGLLGYTQQKQVINSEVHMSKDRVFVLINKPEFHNREFFPYLQNFSN